MSYYQQHVFFCTHQREEGVACCANHQAKALFNYAKEKVKEMQLNGVGKCRINQAGCLDRCGEGPLLVVYPEGVWYRYKNQADVDEIIEQHIKNGQIVKRLKI
jgi:(2Fe-2S) ferredoxin